MKKAIPTSLVLVALSLIGFVILQINWVIGTELLQEQGIKSRADRAVYAAADSLRKMNLYNNINYSIQQFSPSNYSYPAPYTKISQVLTNNEVKKVIYKMLSDNNISTLNFEYAISYGGGFNRSIEYMSPGFLIINQKINNNSDLSYNTSSIINNQPGDDGGNISINELLTIIIPNISMQAWKSLIWILLGSALLTLITIAAFYLTIRTMFQQRRLSKIKSDFINNMTHEFKTPLATISLAIDALQNPRVRGNFDKTNYFNGIIKEENKRMNKHVETILQAALMEKQELHLNRNELHIHQILKKIKENFHLQLLDKNGEVVMHLNAANDAVFGDEVHIVNLFNNLIDNAVKYAKIDHAPRIVITTINTGKHLVVQMKDNGIGMSKESVKKIFEKFYRAHTGNLHNVKGFGLGMTYVKDIIDAHKGKIRVESVLGKGSTFIVDLPLYNQKSK